MDPLTVAALIAIPMYLLLFAVLAFALFVVIRYGVRFGMRDHHRWLQRQARELGEDASTLQAPRR